MIRQTWRLCPPVGLLLQLAALEKALSLDFAEHCSAPTETATHYSMSVNPEICMERFLAQALAPAVETLLRHFVLRSEWAAKHAADFHDVVQFRALLAGAEARAVGRVR